MSKSKETGKGNEEDEDGTEERVGVGDFGSNLVRGFKSTNNVVGGSKNSGGEMVKRNHSQEVSQ